MLFLTSIITLQLASIAATGSTSTSNEPSSILTVHAADHTSAANQGQGAVGCTANEILCGSTCITASQNIKCCDGEFACSKPASCIMPGLCCSTNINATTCAQNYGIIDENGQLADWAEMWFNENDGWKVPSFTSLLPSMTGSFPENDLEIPGATSSFDSSAPSSSATNDGISGSEKTTASTTTTAPANSPSISNATQIRPYSAAGMTREEVQRHHVMLIIACTVVMLHMIYAREI